MAIKLGSLLPKAAVPKATSAAGSILLGAARKSLNPWLQALVGAPTEAGVSEGAVRACSRQGQRDVCVWVWGEARGLSGVLGVGWSWAGLLAKPLGPWADGDSACVHFGTAGAAVAASNGLGWGEEPALSVLASPAPGE